MRPFEYFEPRTLDEAVDLLTRYEGRASILAGGTDLLVEIKEHLRAVDYVVNIKRIPGMDHFMYDDAAGLRFGALVTVRALEISPVINERYAGLAEAARQLGSIQIRHRATAAGNICRASPSADTLPPLIADGASLALYGPQGARSVAMDEFFTGPGKTVKAYNEILTEIAAPAPLPWTGKAYIKHGRRKAMELATVGVAVTLSLERDTCRAARIVLGAVAPTPIRVPDAENALIGAVIDETVIRAAAEAAEATARPISDVRSSAAYRREMVRVLTARAIEQALDKARRSEAVVMEGGMQ